MQHNNGYDKLLRPQVLSNQQEQIEKEQIEMQESNEFIQNNPNVDILEEFSNLRINYAHRLYDELYNSILPTISEITEKIEHGNFYTQIVRNLFDAFSAKYEKLKKAASDLTREISITEDICRKFPGYKNNSNNQNVVYKVFLRYRKACQALELDCKDLLIEKDKIYKLMVKRDVDALSFYKLSPEDLY